MFLYDSKRGEKKNKDELTNRIIHAIGWEGLSKDSIGPIFKVYRDLGNGLARSVDWGGT
jgi:hypothetical protein